MHGFRRSGAAGLAAREMQLPSPPTQAVQSVKVLRHDARAPGARVGVCVLEQLRHGQRLAVAAAQQVGGLELILFEEALRPVRAGGAAVRRAALGPGRFRHRRAELAGTRLASWHKACDKAAKLEGGLR